MIRKKNKQPVDPAASSGKKARALPGLSISISKRIILTFSLMILGLTAIILFLLINTIDFSNRYNGVLENAYYLNDINTKANKQALRIL